MSNPYVGEIRSFGFNFAPSGWAFCQGQLLPISQYDVLFNLLGTTYGGDGVNTFALPDLRSRTAIHNGTGGGGTYVLGQTGGVETVTLTSSQIAHSHGVSAQGAPGNSTTPDAGYLAGSTLNQYAATSTGSTGAMLTSTGGGQPHTNLQPYLCVNYSISLFGIFPSRN